MNNKGNRIHSMSFAFGERPPEGRPFERDVKIHVNRMDFTIMFIPHYNTDKYPFPPFEIDPNGIVYKGPEYNEADGMRIKGFAEGEIIFFEYTEKAGQVFKIEYEYQMKNGMGKNHILIVCIDTENYEGIVQNLWENFRFLNQNSIGRGYRRDQIIHHPSIAFIDKMLNEHKEDLPKMVRDSLEL